MTIKEPLKTLSHLTPEDGFALRVETAIDERQRRDRVVRTLSLAAVLTGCISMGLWAIQDPVDTQFNTRFLTSTDPAEAPVCSGSCQGAAVYTF